MGIESLVCAGEKVESAAKAEQEHLAFEWRLIFSLLV
jgi:hypothetical protein